MTYRRRTARFSSSSEREACLVPPLCMGDSAWTNIYSCLVWSNIFKTKTKISWDECLHFTMFCVLHLPSCSWHYLQSIFSLFSVDLKRKVNKMSSDTHSCLSSKFSSIHSGLLGEDKGDFTSGLGATGWTGLVCLAASFFRLICLFSNISWTELCFWKTFSTWSCWRQETTSSLGANKPQRKTYTVEGS